MDAARRRRLARLGVVVAPVTLSLVAVLIVTGGGQTRPEGGGLRAAAASGLLAVTESYLQGLAKQIPGLDLAKWMIARRDQKFASQLAADAQAANGNGMTSTPGFLIGKDAGSRPP